MRAVRMADFNSSALAEHAWNAGDRVDWSEVTILDQYENLHIRLSLEACHIRKQPLPLNRDKGSLMTILKRTHSDHCTVTPNLKTSIIFIPHFTHLFPAAFV